MLDNSSMEAETLAIRSDKKSRGKVPKKVHKAEREKMKREHLNDLFLDLANSLDLSEQPNGKASVLTDATRMIKDMISQIESLRKENAALTSEEQDVTGEKKELQDENFALESQIAELQMEVQKRIAESRIDLNEAPIEMERCSFAPHTLDGSFQHPAPESIIQGQNFKPIYVIPICPAPAISPDPSTLQTTYSPASIVRKPHARYPSPGDAWPSQILERTPESG